MKTQYAVALAIVAGFGFGAVATQGLHAQTKPPVYMVAEIDVMNPEGYAKEYLPPAQASIKAHGGRYIAAGKATGIDGAPPKSRVVVLAWDSLEQLLAWRNSPEYVAARKVGEKYAKYRLFAVEGVTR